MACTGFCEWFWNGSTWELISSTCSEECDPCSAPLDPPDPEVGDYLTVQCLAASSTTTTTTTEEPTTTTTTTTTEEPTTTTTTTTTEEPTTTTTTTEEPTTTTTSTTTSTTTTTTTPACECVWRWNATSETWLVITRGCNPENPECFGGCSYPPTAGTEDGEEVATECAYLNCEDCCPTPGNCCPTTTTTTTTQDCGGCIYIWSEANQSWSLLQDCYPGGENCLCGEAPTYTPPADGVTFAVDCSFVGQMMAPQAMMDSTPTPTTRPPITPEARAMLAIIKQRIRVHCRHIGGELETRSSCGCGKSSLRHSCAILGECRVHAPRATDGLPQCTKCPHYEAPNG